MYNNLKESYEKSNLKNVWEEEYEKVVLNDVLFSGQNIPYEITDCLDEHYNLCLFAVKKTIQWLNSKEGIELINKSFKANISIDNAISTLGQEETPILIDISKNRDTRAYRGFRKYSFLIKLWNNEYKDKFFNYFYPLAKEYLNSLENTKNESIEELYEPMIITIDTLICWLNSPVGRYFVKEAYNVKIPDGLDGMFLEAYQQGIFSKDYLLEYGLSEEEIEKLPQP